MKKKGKIMHKKMPPEMTAKRKASMMQNAAGKVMGGLYSK